MQDVHKTKRNNLIVLSVFLLLIVLCAVMLAVRNAGGEKRKVSETTSAKQTEVRQTTAPAATPVPTAAPSAPQTASDSNALQDALFIGDSRTVGIAEYASVTGADFFCDVGMSVYNIHKKTISVKNVGKVTLEQLLSAKKYRRVYIMLGINEVGYNLDTTVQKYQELVRTVQQKQPDAVLFLQANLHVTKERSQKDAVVNNPALNQLNEKIKGLADNKRIFYLDANPVFDDAQGNLAADKTGDNAHLYAKYYKQWGAWIVSASDKLYKGK